MSSNPSESPLKPLRLWPGLLFVALIWTLRVLPGMVDEPNTVIFTAAFFGPLLCALLILFWWLTASRASAREKIAGGLGLVAIVVATHFLVHPTMQGFGTMFTAVPWGISAFVIAVAVAGKVAPQKRTAIALLAAALGFGYWTLVRLDGTWGNFKFQHTYRWQSTAEDDFLAQKGASGSGASVGGPLSEAEWPGFRGPGRDSVVPGVALAEDWEAQPPQELWRIRVGPGWSSFAVAGRRLYTQEQRGDNEAVVAYDADSGAELWVHEYPSRFYETIGGPGPRATPTLAGDMMFTLGAEGVLHRLDPVTGEVVWQTDIRDEAGREPPMWGFASSPLVVDDLVIVYGGGEEDRGVLAYSVDDGTLRWGAPTGGHSYSSPQLSQVAGRRTVPLVSDDGLTLLDPTDGSVLWQYEWPFDNYRVLQPLVVDDSTLLMSTGMGIGTRRLDVRAAGGSITADERWTSRGLKPDFNDFAAHEGFLYGLDPNILSCIDLETGERRWKGGRYGHGQLLLLPKADQLLVLGEKGELFLVRADPEGLDELARFKVLEGKTWNHPVLVGDRLYVRNGEEAVALAMPMG
jgi:outer membrane protein assembly factor BamB